MQRDSGNQNNSVFILEAVMEAHNGDARAKKLRVSSNEANNTWQDNNIM